MPSLRRFNGFRGAPARLTEGWRLSGITTFQTGFPLGLVDTSDNSLTCWQGLTSYGCPDRPNVTGPVILSNPRNTSLVNSTQGGTRLRSHYYFNPNSFAPEARGVLGNAGRNYFHGPGINNWDLAVAKDTHITEAARIEMRIEFFNLFNHTQFDAPGTDVHSPSSFGIVSGAAAPRIIQLGVKILF